MRFWSSPLFSATSGIVLGLSFFNPMSVQAAIITYDLVVDIDSGPLLGNSYSGFFSYDDSSVTPTGFSSADITNLEFEFAGVTYTESDDTASVAQFSNANFLGIDYAVSPPPSPTFTSGFVDISGAFFSYDLDPDTLGQGGTGEITYTLRPATAVPEPSAILGLLTLGFLGLTKFTD